MRYNPIMIPDHLSYSALKTWERCPKQFQLGRIVKAQSLPAWYFAAGTAVHLAFDDYDATQGEMQDWKSYFYPLVSDAMKIEPDTSKWMAGGSEADPETGPSWDVLGPQILEKYKSFPFEAEHIELDVSAVLPNGVKVQGYTDRIGTLGVTDELKFKAIVDIKSGRNMPKDKGDQLRVYSMLYMLNTGELIEKGAYYNAREGKIGKVYDLKMQPDEWRQLLDRFARAWDDLNTTQVFEAKREFSCKFCEHKLNCWAYSGNTPRTKYYDPDHRETNF